MLHDAITIEEWTLFQSRDIELFIQSGQDGGRQQLEHCNVVLVDPLLECVMVGLQVAPDPMAELSRNSILHKVILQDLLLFCRLAFHPPQHRHLRGDAADEGGECDHGKEKNHDRIQPLCSIFGVYFHCCRCELGERPMQRCCVFEGLWHFTQGILFEPILVFFACGSNPEPAASDVVIHDENESGKSDQVQHDFHSLRPDRFQHLHHLVVQFYGADQAQGSDNSGGPCGFADAQDCVCPQAVDEERPIGCHNTCVEQKPCPQIVPRNVGGPHL
mmetsp:Transcript_7549/g.18913  ORF Transcript_7549/g.18913 Transcript_7549/m.18913 type:complete len:274 (-) Transcript_7549:610-1431(-)